MSIRTWLSSTYSRGKAKEENIVTSSGTLQHRYYSLAEAPGSFGSNLLVAMGPDGHVAYSFTSGQTWNEVPGPFAAGTSVTALTYGKPLNLAGGRFVAIAENGQTAFSLDGRNWTRGKNLPSFTADTVPWNVVTGYKDFVCACNQNQTRVYRSIDGENWTAQTIKEPVRAICAVPHPSRPEHRYIHAVHAPGRTTSQGAMVENTIFSSMDGVGTWDYDATSFEKKDVGLASLTSASLGYSNSYAIGVGRPYNDGSFLSHAQYNTSGSVGLGSWRQMAGIPSPKRANVTWLSVASTARELPAVQQRVCAVGIYYTQNTTYRPGPLCVAALIGRPTFLGGTWKTVELPGSMSASVNVNIASSGANFAVIAERNFYNINLATFGKAP